MRKFLNYFKHVVLENKKLSLIVFVFVFVLPVSLALYSHFALTPLEQAQNEAIFKDMQASQVSDGIDPALIGEIDILVINGKYEEAQQKAEELLEQDLVDKDRTNVYAQLALICQKTADFKCIDRVIDQYDSTLQYDYFYVNDVAELALSKNNKTKAKEYYTGLLAELDKNGGLDKIKSLNDGAMKQLDYEKIKSGAVGE